MESEIYFLRYAYPCSHILCNVRGEIGEEDFEILRLAALGERETNKEKLEKIFWRAFERIEKIAEELGKDKWDISVIREYFRARHNTVLDDSDYPDSFKEQCKVYEGEVIDMKNGDMVVAYASGTDGKKKKRRVRKDYLENIRVGDRVTIHWGYAIEKL